MKSGWAFTFSFFYDNSNIFFPVREGTIIPRGEYLPLFSREELERVYDHLGEKKQTNIKVNLGKINNSINLSSQQHGKQWNFLTIVIFGKQLLDVNALKSNFV